MVLSLLKNILKKLAIILATLIFLTFLTAQVPTWLGFFLFRSLVWILAKTSRPDLNSFVIKQNAICAVYPPNVPHNSLNIILLFVINGQLTVERIRQLFKERVLNQVDHKNRLIYLRLRQYWTSFLGFAFWKTDRNFSIDKHVREYDYTGELGIPCPCQQIDLVQVFGKLVDSPWQEDQSPWEILVINDFIQDNSVSVEPKTCLVIKINHVLCDGYSILNLLKLLFELKASMPNMKINQRKFSFLEKIGLVFRVPYDFVEQLIGVLSAKHVFNRELSKEVICSVSPSVPVSLVKEIKNHYKVSYAAVVQCAIQGVIARGLRSAKMAVPKNSLCQLILPMPKHPGGMVFHSNAMPVKFSCDAPTSVDRLYKIQKTLKDLSRSTAGMGTLALVELNALYPIKVKESILNGMSSGGMSYAVTNFPATATADYFDGLEVTQMMANVGTYNMGMTIVGSGTNNQQVFCFNTDKNLFGSEEVARTLGSLFLEELQDLAREMV